MKRIISILILAIAFSSIQAQTDELNIHFTKKSDKFFGKNENKDKIIEFEIEGIENENDKNTLIEKFLKNDFVIDFTIVPATFDSKRKAFAVFKRSIRIENLQSLLISVGVSKVYIDKEEIPVENLTEWAENKKATK